MTPGLFERIRYTLPFWWAPRRMAYYVGCVNLDNLGDELMLPAFESLFCDWRFAHHRPVGPCFLQRTLEGDPQRMAILGGGTMIAGDGAGARHQRFARAVARFGNGVVFGSGVMWAGPEPRNSKLFRQLPGWAETFKRCRYVGVRGPYSAAALGELGVRAEMIGDPVCQFVREKLNEHRRPTVGINVGLIHDQQVPLLENLIHSLCQVVKWLARLHVQVELFVVRPGDENITREFAERARVGNAQVHSVYHDPNLYIDRVSGMSLFIGLKLHAAALAMCAGVPTLSIAYEPKTHDFMHGLKQHDHSLDFSTITADSLIAHSESLLERGEAVADQVRVEMRRIRDLQKRRAEQLAGAIRGEHAWPAYETTLKEFAG